MKLFQLRFHGKMRWTDDGLEWHLLEVYANSLFEAKRHVLVDYQQVSQIAEVQQAA